MIRYLLVTLFLATAISSIQAGLKFKKSFLKSPSPEARSSVIPKRPPIDDGGSGGGDD